MRTLDRTRPYGQVYGPSSHAFEQDGLRFLANGALHPDDRDKLGTGEEVETITVEPATPPVPDFTPKPTVAPKYDRVDLALMHYKKLQKLMEDEGLEYVDKEDALDRLSAL